MYTPCTLQARPHFRPISQKALLGLKQPPGSQGLLPKVPLLSTHSSRGPLPLPHLGLWRQEAHWEEDENRISEKQCGEFLVVGDIC